VCQLPNEGEKASAMKTSTPLILSTSPLSRPTGKPRKTVSLGQRQRFLYRGSHRHSTGKERDIETGLYYFGARYLDSKTGRWISGDPAMGEYVPEAPVDDEARKRNKNLPGQGGVFNYVNLHVYHYAGNNPVKYSDPDGMWIAFKKQIDRFNKHHSLASNPQPSLDPGAVTRTIKIPTRAEARKAAEQNEQSDLLPRGIFSRDVGDAVNRDLGLKGIEAENYKKEETARYEAFKSLREKSESLTELNEIINTAQKEYNKELRGGSRQEDKRRADVAANKIIDDFIHSKDPSYMPPIKEEP